MGKFEQKLRELIEKQVRSNIYRPGSTTDEEVQDEVDSILEKFAEMFFQEFKHKMNTKQK